MTIPPDVIDEALQSMRHLGELQRSFPGRIARVPLIGGPFGVGRFELCSLLFSVPAGLDWLMYSVVELRCGLVLGSGKTKQEALRTARQLLLSIGRHRFDLFCAETSAAQAAAESEVQREIHAERSALRAEHAKVSSIPRRRRQMFARAGGRCHYCSCDLDLHGRWHIDHKLPRALGGGNEPENLVVACVQCNQNKSDKTDAEFIRGRKA